jgi:hypothetical protein
MKFYETHFEEYLKSHDRKPLHPKNEFNKSSIHGLDNLIIYGGPGIGKYTHALSIIRDYSPTNLKYEKKMVISYNKLLYYFKMSDIHYEIDMSLLGCNSKLLWHEIYNHIYDIISAKQEKRGIILCKYFHEIHAELLDIFYSYMQLLYNNNITIKFIFLTENISFLPDNILNYCMHIKLSRPAKSTYKKYFKANLSNNDSISLITNIKDLKTENTENPENPENTENTIKRGRRREGGKEVSLVAGHKNICDKIIEIIIDYDSLKFVVLRDLLYDICIFDLNIVNCCWYIITTLIKKDLLDNKKLMKILVQTFIFFKYYNNNYRPIYHLEKYILYIILITHEL